MTVERNKNERLLTRREREAIGAFVGYRALGGLWRKQQGIEKVAGEYGIRPQRMKELADLVLARPPSDGVTPSCGDCGGSLDTVEGPPGLCGPFALCPSCDAEYWEMDSDDQADFLHDLYPDGFR